MANNDDKNSFSDEILKLAQTLMPEPPTAKVKRMVAEIADKGIDRQLHEIGWKAYDTVVGAAHAATGRVLTSPTVGQVLGSAIDITLRWQRFNAAVAGAFFATFWPAVGLPTAGEVEAIRSDVRAMREELRDAVAERDAREDFAGDLHLAIRESMVAKPAADRSADRKPNEHAEQASHQFSIWSGWPGVDITELAEDVGN
jgi:hypothetical protein